ncbi:VWFA domain-containing protein [Mycena kentingensis (nom. inval.)]|nr:VWFA domain-containing protein [Mycena kentingensis (nom. inval.)]
MAGRGNINSNMPNQQAAAGDVDVVFLHDATGSQQPYLTSARKFAIDRIKVYQAGIKSPASVRFRVVAFRDHREQGDAWMVDDTQPFTFDRGEVEAQLARLVASGGGDGPEAQLDALDAVRRSAWRRGAARIVIMITDSPPHGLESADYPASHPKGLKPNTIIQDFRDSKISLFVVGCVPTINSYGHAVSYYKDFCQKTLGRYAELPNPSSSSKLMDSALVGSMLHATDTARIERRWEGWIRDKADHGHGAIATAIHSKLSSEGEECHELSCSSHGGHDIKYHSGPVSRARVDEIVAKALSASESRMVSTMDDFDDALFGAAAAQGRW